MEINEIFMALVTGGIGAIGSSILTVYGLRVQIGYIEKNIEKLESGLGRAHERIDEIGKQP